MPCYRPITAYYSKIVNPTGKRSLVFNVRDAQNAYEPFDIPCGQCIHCRLEKSRQWAMRCVHEASLYEDNCFVTLTYSDEHLPENGFLDYDAPVLFMKRLRKMFGDKIRSYGCAEYGEKKERPHYHLLIFNHDFTDKILWKDQGENSLYVSNTLTSLWPYGHSTCGALTFESAAYTARYCTKKITVSERTPENLRRMYERSNPITGEIFELPPEKSVCVSRGGRSGRGGIGKEWYEKHGKYLRDHDHAIIRGKKVRPAKYYDRLFDLADPENFRDLKVRRRNSGEEAKIKLENERKAAYAEYISIHGEDSFPTNRDRTYVMEDHHEAVAKILKRGYENGET